MRSRQHWLGLCMWCKTAPEPRGASSHQLARPAESTVSGSDFSHRSYAAALGPACSSARLLPGGKPQPNAPATRLSSATEMSLLNARHVKYALLGCTRKANIYWLPKSFLELKAQLLPWRPDSSGWVPLLEWKRKNSLNSLYLGSHGKGERSVALDSDREKVFRG